MPGKKRSLSQVIDLTAEQLETASKAVMGRRTAASTKTNYASKVKIITEWFAAKYPSALGESGVLVLPLQESHVVEFFTSKCLFGYQRLELKGPEELTELQLENEPFNHDYLAGFRSGLVDLYRSKLGEKLPASLDEKLKTILEGYDKLCNDLKKKGLMKLSPGKRELRRNGYVLLCTKLMKYVPTKPLKTKNGAVKYNGSWSSTIFGWCFFTLLWNLISRPESTESLQLNMFTWKDDCLAIDEHVSSSM